MSGTGMRAIVVRIGGERYAVPAEAVEEILDRPALSPVPRVEAHVLGLLLLRDRWIPVIDPAPRIGLPSTASCAAALVVRRGAGYAAIAVEEVGGLVEIDAPAREEEGAAETRVVATADGPLAMLDPAALLPASLQPDAVPPPGAEQASEVAVVGFRAGGFALAMEIGHAEGVVEAAQDTGLEVIDIPALVANRTAEVGTAAGADDPGVLLVVRSADGRVGIRCDLVEGVLSRGVRLEPIPPLLAARTPTWLRALARDPGGVHAVVDPHLLLQAWREANASERASGPRRERRKRSAAPKSARPARKPKGGGPAPPAEPE